MNKIFQLLLAFAAFFLTTFAAPVLTVAPSNDVTALNITKANTVNSTVIVPSNTTSRFRLDAVAGTLPLALVNNMPGNDQVNAYVTGRDASGKLVMLQPDGTFYYPTAGAGAPQEINANVAIPLGGQGSTTSITIPGYITSARIYFAVGHLHFYTVLGGGQVSLVEPSAVNPADPSAAVNWGFVEFDYGSGGIYANISYVDFLGLILGMKLTTTDGNTQGAKGLKPGSVAAICQALEQQQQQDGAPWGDLCQQDGNGNKLRILSPTDFISAHPDAFNNYWSGYIDQVWDNYSKQPLYINTQQGAGTVSCQVSGGTLNCNGDNRSYNKPTALDIFGCNSGPFGIIGSDNDVHKAIVPRLCAAFDRTTLMLFGGNTQPSPWFGSNQYYDYAPTNFYSKFIHQYEIDGKGYAFAYDDVNPDGENQSGTVAGQPQLLSVYVGGDI